MLPLLLLLLLLVQCVSSSLPVVHRSLPAISLSLSLLSHILPERCIRGEEERRVLFCLSLPSLMHRIFSLHSKPTLLSFPLAHTHTEADTYTFCRHSLILSWSRSERQRKNISPAYTPTFASLILNSNNTDRLTDISHWLFLSQLYPLIRLSVWCCLPPVSFSHRQE